jgi:long-subunit acyl-CoA synthetase (AMP-forming)
LRRDLLFRNGVARAAELLRGPAPPDAGGAGGRDREGSVDFAPVWAAQNELAGTPLEALATKDKLIAAVQDGVDRGNQKLARVEQIKKFTIIPGDWMPGGDELTPTMKLKRKPIAQKYAAEIEVLYR